MIGKNFTPGPWKSEWAYGVGNDPLYLTVRQVEGNYRGEAAQVHQAEHIGGITREEMIANAHLIAAAPELHAALEEVFSSLSAGDDRSDDAWVDLNGTQVQMIVDALAKARGES